MRIVIAAVTVFFMVACQQANVPASATPEDVPPTTGNATDAPSTIEIVAVDYRFDGLPEILSVGTSLSLRNEGTETHELVLLRVQEDTDIESFVQLTEEEMLQRAEMIGVLVAAPDETAEETITVSEAGLYLAVCFIPIGTVDEHEHEHEHEPSPSTESVQVQHYSVGMYASFSAG